MKEFSTAWKSSKNPGKQRKYAYNAPLHIRQKFIRINLSKELRKNYGRRNIGVSKGDAVKILRGKFKNKTGKVERVDLKRTNVYVNGVEAQKKDGSKAAYPLHPSNLMITELMLEDRKRRKIIEENKS